MRLRRALAILAVSFLAFAVMHPVAAQAPKEVAGAKDHPLLKRFAGSIIIGYESRDFDEMSLLLSPLKLNEGQPAIDEAQTVRGKHTRILYVAPAQRSSLEIFANYEDELGRVGFAELFRCSGANACDTPGADLWHGVYPVNHRLQNSDLSKFAFNVPSEPQYLAATLARPEGDVALSLYIATEHGSPSAQTNDRTLILLDIVEPKPLEAQMVTVDAAAMAKDIAASGKVALYGIYFDSDKSDIKPASQPALDEIAKLLKSQPELKIYIVGHTDNAGGLDYNVSLSQRRAKAVVDRLVSAYSIKSTRLRPVGAGLIAPVATNDTEEGRAKNRRVEIVKE